MSTCEICNSEIVEGDRSCNICGYDATRHKFSSEERLRAYYQKLRTGEPWPEEVLFKGKLKSVLKCPHQYLVKLLRQSKSLISEDLKLAQVLVKHAYLSESGTKDEAKKKMGQLGAVFAGTNSEEAVKYEKQLQKHLYSNWSRTTLADEWRLFEEGTTSNGQYRAGNAGIIDLLAKHKTENKWLVIELKRDQVSDTTVGQTLRYMGWVQENLADKDSQVMGLIVSALPDEHIRLALKCVTNIALVIYRISNGTFEFLRPDEAKNRDFRHFLQTLSPEEFEKLETRLKKLEDSGVES
jgi:hypothetical protein